MINYQEVWEPERFLITFSFSHYFVRYLWVDVWELGPSMIYDMQVVDYLTRNNFRLNAVTFYYWFYDEKRKESLFTTEGCTKNSSTRLVHDKYVTPPPCQLAVSTHPQLNRRSAI